MRQYPAEPNPADVLDRLQRELEDGDRRCVPEEELRGEAPPPHSPSGLKSNSNQSEVTAESENHRSSFDREASWLAATRPTLGDIILAPSPRVRPRPSPPPPPIRPAKTYNRFIEFCLGKNPLCWPCSDGREKMPAFEVFLQQLIIESNNGRYGNNHPEILDENGKLAARRRYVES